MGRRDAVGAVQSRVGGRGAWRLAEARADAHRGLDAPQERRAVQRDLEAPLLLGLRFGVLGARVLGVALGDFVVGLGLGLGEDVCDPGA